MVSGVFHARKENAASLVNVASMGECRAQVHSCPMQIFVTPELGAYLFTVAAVQGGSLPGRTGGLGAVLQASAKLQAQTIVYIIVAGQGSPGGDDPSDLLPDAGGGGLSAVYTVDGPNALPTITAGEESPL